MLRNLFSSTAFNLELLTRGKAIILRLVARRSGGRRGFASK